MLALAAGGALLLDAGKATRKAEEPDALANYLRATPARRRAGAVALCPTDPAGCSDWWRALIDTIFLRSVEDARGTRAARRG